MALVFAFADFDVARVLLARDRLDPADQMLDLGRRPIQFNNQQRRHVLRVAGLNEFLGGLDGEGVHHFHAARNNSVGDNRSHAIAAFLITVEAQQHCLGGFRFL